jgi:hypothetical protein
MGVLYLMCWRRNYPQDRGTRPAQQRKEFIELHLRDAHVVEEILREGGGVIGHLH